MSLSPSLEQWECYFTHMKTQKRKKWLDGWCPNPNPRLGAIANPMLPLLLTSPLRSSVRISLTIPARFAALIAGKVQVASSGNKIVLFDEHGKKQDEHFIKRDKLEPDLEIDAERFLIQLVAQLTQAAAVAAPQLPGGRQPAPHYPAPPPKRGHAQPSSASTTASGLQGLDGLACPCRRRRSSQPNHGWSRLFTMLTAARHGEEICAPPRPLAYQSLWPGWRRGAGGAALGAKRSLHPRQRFVPPTLPPQDPKPDVLYGIFLTVSPVLEHPIPSRCLGVYICLPMADPRSNSACRIMGPEPCSRCSPTASPARRHSTEPANQTTSPSPSGNSPGTADTRRSSLGARARAPVPRRPSWHGRGRSGMGNGAATAALPVCIGRTTRSWR